MKKCKTSHSQFDKRPSVTASLLGGTPVSLKPLAATVSESASGERFLQLHNSVTTNPQLQAGNIRKSFSSSSSSGIKKLFITKRNEQQLDQDYLTKALAREYPILRSLSLEKTAKEEIGNAHLEFIYTTLAYTSSNFVGAPSLGNAEPKELQPYIDSTIKLPFQMINKCIDQAKNIKPPKYFLKVTVHKAVDLIPSDADGLCDPYCKMSINSSKDISITSIKGRTLNPSWNESFVLQVNDLSKDVLHIEVWDKDPQGLRANLQELRERGTKSGWLFCRECCQNLFPCLTGSVDDFIGKLDVDLKDIYLEGIDQLAALKDKRENGIGGHLHFSAEFIVMRPKHISENLKRHLMLFKKFLLHGLQQGGGDSSIVSQWEQILSPPALTLMLQHRVQSSLNLAEDLLIRFIVFINAFQYRRDFDYQFLYCMIEGISKSTQQLMNSDCGLENNLEDLYKNAIDMVQEECTVVLNGIHSIDFTDKIRCIEFEYILKCLLVCCEISRKIFPWATMKSEAVTWLENVADEMQNKDLKIRTDFIIQTTHSILCFNTAVDEIIRRVFPEQSYTMLTCEILDSILSESFKSHIRTVSAESEKYVGDLRLAKAKEAVDLFLKIKELNEYLIKVLSKPATNLNSFRDWFGTSVFEGWFQCKEIIIAQKIPQIVSRDSLENMVLECAGRTEKQSLSVRSTVSLIQKELVTLWQQVSHPNYSQLDAIFLQVLHFICMKYAEALLGLIQSRHLLGNFRGLDKRKLSVVANNLWSLAIFVKETILNTVSDVSPDHFHTKHSLQLICRIICEDISQEMQHYVLTLIEKVVFAQTKKTQSRAVTKCSERISSLFKDGKEFMAFEVYLLYSEQLWKFIVKVVGFFKNLYQDADSKYPFLLKYCRRPNVLQGLQSVLIGAEKLCYVDPEGKLKPFMWTDEFLVLKKQLQQQIMYG